MEAACPDDAVEVGRVLGGWGIKGWIRVQPYSSDPQALFSSRRWHLLPPEGTPAAVAGRWPSLLKVTQAREHGDLVVASAQDLDDRDAADALRGGRIFVPRSSFPTAGEGEYYWVDLIGLSVVNRQGEPLGEVVGLIETGPQCVLRVQPPEGEALPPDEPERLIPFVKAYIDDVDLPARRLLVDWARDY